MNSEVQSLLKCRNTAFRSGDRAAYRAARADLKRGIREAKAAYKRKVEDHFTDNNPRRMWQGINHITNYRSSNQTTALTAASLAENLNHFFALFEMVRSSASSSTPFPPAPAH